MKRSIPHLSLAISPSISLDLRRNIIMEYLKTIFEKLTLEF
jgi:hypothetical protein